MVIDKSGSMDEVTTIGKSKMERVKGAIIFMDSRFKQKYNWISEWIRNEIEIVPDKSNAIIQQLYPFWNEN